MVRCNRSSKICRERFKHPAKVGFVFSDVCPHSFPHNHVSGCGTSLCQFKGVIVDCVQFKGGKPMGKKKGKKGCK